MLLFTCIAGVAFGRYLAPAPLHTHILFDGDAGPKAPLDGGTRRKLAPASTAGGVYINGLTKPVQVTWSDGGLVFVAEKAGKIKMFPGWVASAASDATVVLDLRGSISSFGDHGLSSILWDRSSDGTAWLYTCYMQNDWGPTGCADSGQLDGRTNPEINGCAIYGARQHAGRPMT